MPRCYIIILFAAVMLLALACDNETVHINAMPGGDPDVQADGDAMDPVVTDGDGDEGIDVPEEPEIPDTADGDEELPWEAPDTEERDMEAPDMPENGYEFDFLDSEFNELSPPLCAGEQENEEAGTQEWTPALVFDDPVQVNRYDHSRSIQKSARIVDCGNGVVLAMWEDSRWPVMYAMSGDNGATWTENRPVPGMTRDLETVVLLGLGVGETAAVAFIADETKTAYLARLTLPVTDMENPQWNTAVNTDLLADQTAMFAPHRDVAVISADIFMLSWLFAGRAYYAWTTDGGAHFSRLEEFAKLFYAALPDNRFLLAVPEVGGGKYYVMSPFESHPGPIWDDLGIWVDQWYSLSGNGSHVALLTKNIATGNVMRSDFNVSTFSFGTPFEIIHQDGERCFPPTYESMHLNRDGRVSYLISCDENLSGEKKMLFGYQETSSSLCTLDEFYTYSPVENPLYSSGLLLDSGKKLVALTIRTTLTESFSDTGLWWEPRIFHDIEVYGDQSGSDPGPLLPLARIATINDDLSSRGQVFDAWLVPLPDGDVGVTWHESGDEALWVNSLRQARQGTMSRWLYNIPELYGSYDPSISPVEPVWIKAATDFITWDGRPCMVTLPALNATEEGHVFESTCVAFSCFDTWSSFTAGARPGPLEKLWCDPWGYPVPEGDGYFVSKELDITYPDENGGGFIRVLGRNNGLQSGMLFYDKVTGQWPYMQFLPRFGITDIIARMDTETLVAFSSTGAAYSYDEGRSWTIPNPYTGMNEDLPVREWVGIQRPDTSFVVVLSMAARDTSNRGNISVLTYDCSSQNWKLSELPELGHVPYAMQVLALENGYIAVFYNTDYFDGGGLFALLLNPDTGWRSDPVALTYFEGNTQYNGYAVAALDALYHDGVLSLVYAQQGPSSADLGFRLLVVQGHLEQSR